MSWEGYIQVICRRGHLCAQDAYSFDRDNFVCPIVVDRKICGSDCAWENQVDTTNGSFDDNGKRIDGCIEPRVSIERKCDHCHSILEEVYEIPSLEGGGR